MFEEVRVYRSKEYKKWHKTLSEKDKRIVDARIDFFIKDGILKNIKCLDRALSFYEFKWTNGLRVYFSLLQDQIGHFMLLLQGGNKNSQQRNIIESKNRIIETVQTIRRKWRDTK